RDVLQHRDVGRGGAAGAAPLVHARRHPERQGRAQGRAPPVARRAQHGVPADLIAPTRGGIPAAMPVSPELIEIVACPKCKGKLELKPDESGFVCAACKLFYAIVDDIPNFLIEEAAPVP